MSKDPVPSPVPSEEPPPAKVKKTRTVGEVISEFIEDPIYKALHEEFTGVTAYIAAQKGHLNEARVRGQPARMAVLTERIVPAEHRAQEIKNLLGRINRFCYEVAHAAKGELKVLGREAHDQRMRDQRAKKEEAQRVHQLKMQEQATRRRAKHLDAKLELRRMELDHDKLRAKHFRRLVGEYIPEALYDQLRDQAETFMLAEVLSASHPPERKAPEVIDDFLQSAVPWPDPPSHWDDIPEHPVEDWRYEVANNDTRLGYLAWVDARRLTARQQPHKASAS